MHDEEITAVAAELAVARTGKPSRPGATHKRILYKPESIRRAVGLFRRSGQSPSAFARRLGVSATALTRWVGDSEDDATFIPVRAAGETHHLASTVPAAAAVAAATGVCETTCTSAAPPKGATVVVRETVISLPADLDLGRVREIMSALRGGASC